MVRNSGTLTRFSPPTSGGKGKRIAAALLIFIFAAASGFAQEIQKLFRVRTVEEVVTEARPRSAVTAVFRVVNLSPQAMEFAGKAVIPEGWGLLSEEESFTLDPGEETVRLVGFLVPARAIAAEYEIVYLVSAPKTTLPDESASIPVRVLLVPGVELEILEQPRLVIAGEEYEVRFLVANRTNRPDTIALSIGGNETGGGASRSERLNLGPGESRSLSAKVRTDPESRALLISRLQLTAKSTSFDDPAAKASVLSTVEVVPRVSGEKNGWHRLPLEFEVIGVGRSGGRIAPQVGISGSGSFDDREENKIDFLFRGPRNPDIIAFFPWQDEARLSLTTNNFDFHVGDRLFTISRLVEFGHYRRGAEGTVRAGDFSLSAYYMVDPALRFDEKQTAFQLGYGQGNAFSLSASYLANQGTRPEGVRSGGMSDSGLFSFQARMSALRELLNVNVEYALGQYRNRDVKAGDAYWLEAYGHSARLNYRLAGIRAGSVFPGYYRDMEFESGDLSYLLLKNLTVLGSFHLQKLNRSLEAAFPASAETYYRTGVSFRLNRSLSMNLEYRDREWQDLRPEPEYHFDENTFRAGANQFMGPLTLFFAVDFGKTQDLRSGQTARLIEYQGNLNLRLAEWLSFGGAILYRDQKKGFVGNRFNRLTANANLNISTRSTSLNAFYQTSFHREFAEEVFVGISRLEQIMLHDLNVFDLSFRQKTGATKSFGVRVRGISRMGRKDYDIIGMADYTIGFGLPVSRKKDKGSLSGRVLDEEHANAPVAGAVVRANHLAAVTNKAGKYTFQSLKPGEYVINIDWGTIGQDYVVRQDLPMKKAIGAGVLSEMNLGLTRAASLDGQVMVYRFSDEGAGRHTPDSGAAEDREDEKSIVEERGLEGILVELTGATTRLTILTDSDGRFSFFNLYPGKWILKISEESFSPLHYLETNDIELALSPGEEKDMLVKVLPKIRTIQFAEQGEIALAVAKEVKAAKDMKKEAPKAAPPVFKTTIPKPSETSQIQNRSKKTASLRDIAITKKAGRLDIDIILEADIAPHTFILAHPGRLVLDFGSMQRLEAPRELEVLSQGIRTVRIGWFKPGTVRVVIESEGAVLPPCLFENTASGFKIIF